MTHPTRRQALLGLGAALAGCAGPQAPHPGRAVAVGPGVYAFIGSGGAADTGNLGRIGNAGFVVGERAVVAIDTGTSYAHGQALLAGIAEVTDKPVRLALVTHTRPEFLFGGAAYRERGIPVAMHARCARLMASRCETCLKTLRQQVGDAPMQGTAMYKPDREFDASHAVEDLGRPLRVLYYGHSSGPGDIAVHDLRSGVLFAGGLLDNRRIPDIQDGDLAGWKRALQALRALQPKVLIPGHGPAGSVAMVDAVERYLDRLQTRVRALLDAGSSLLEVPDAADLPEFADWDQYEIVHRRNAAVAFIRFERELLFK